MARIREKGMKGRIGDKIYSSWNGRPYVKSRPEHVENPRTEAQTAHRMSFAEVARLSSAMSEAHRVGLRKVALREKLNTQSVFRRLNKDVCSQDGVDYKRVVLSKGPVANVSVTSVELGSDGVLRMEHEMYGNGGSEDDVVYAFVYCAGLREGYLSEGVARGERRVTAALPNVWRGERLHVYVFVKDRVGAASGTLYVGEMDWR